MALNPPSSPLADWNTNVWGATGGLDLAFTYALPAAVPLGDAAKTAITGTETDDRFAVAIGKPIPVFLGGQILAGNRLIEGPFFTTVTSEGFVDIITSPFVMAVPGATIDLSSLRLNGTESFTSADGGATWTALGAVFAAVEINVLYGTEEQTPFASSIARYGARAVPYRSHVCVELKNIPLDPFNNEIPFVSVYVEQEEFLTRKVALERAARYARYNDDEFEIEVSGQDIFWIAIEPGTFIAFVQDLQRTVLRNCNIVASDKLRIFENSSTVTPIEITRDDVAADSIRFWQDAPESVPALREMGFVDVGRDNDFNTVKAVRARFPVPLTASQDSEQFDIPIGMAAPQAKAIVNKSLLIDDIARDKFACKVLPHMRGLQPGDIIAPNVDADITWATGRIISIARNASDWTSEIVAERIDLALLPTGPSITSNGGGVAASLTVNENTTAVTTVTADQEGTFSIAGGADAAFFTIDPGTGVLAFLVAPDFEDPQDTGANNTYQVIVQVLADGLTGTQIITVTVANVLDSVTHYTMPAATGAFTLVGVAAGLLRSGYRLTASTGTFALTGVAASLRASRMLTASTGTFALAGVAVTLTRTLAVVTWDSGTVAGVTLSGGNLVATNTGTTSTNQGARVATGSGKSSGKYYFEITWTAKPSPGTSNLGLGIGTTASTYSSLGPSATGGDLTYAGGSIYANGSLAVSSTTWAAGATCGVAVDLDNRKIWFHGTPSGLWNFGGGGSNDPATNVGGITIPSGTMVPFVVFGGTGGVANNIFTANFGASAFTGTVPSGFTAGWPV